jgi:ketosteroid isomerase-like protein
MSTENVEPRFLAEAAFGALNSRNLDAFIDVVADDVEFTSMVAEMEGTTFRGHDGIRAWWDTVVGAFGDVRWTVLDVRGSGDWAVAHVRMDGTLGEVPVKLTMWLTARQRDGKVTWWSWHRTEQEALEASELRGAGARDRGSGRARPEAR